MHLISSTTYTDFVDGTLILPLQSAHSWIILHMIKTVWYHHVYGDRIVFSDTNIISDHQIHRCRDVMPVEWILAKMSDLSKVHFIAVHVKVEYHGLDQMVGEIDLSVNAQQLDSSIDVL